MKVYELFSKRQKRLRGEVPDVYQYEDIPQKLRVQVVHIWQDVFGEIERGSWGFRGVAYEAYQGIHEALCREYGVFALGEEKNFLERVGNFLLKEKDIEKTLDVIELSFLYIDRAVRNQPNIYIHPKISPDETINELNYRFREHGVGYQYKSGKIIKMDSEFSHSEVVKPTMSFLADPIYKGANEEFLKAHEHYREGRYKECLNECLKAFESCLKTICQKRSWEYDDKRSTASESTSRRYLR